MTDQSDSLEPKHQLSAPHDRITKHVNAIARFVGQSAELQVQTQMRLDRLVETIESLVTTTQEHHTSINQRIDNLLTASERQQQSIRDVVK